MERRQFVLGGAAGTAAAASTSLAAPALAQERYEFDMVTTWPRNFPGLGTGAQRLADRLKTMSQGRLTVNLHAAGELVPPLESFNAVRQGTAQMAHSTPYYWQGNHPAINFFTSAPYALLHYEHNGWMRWGGGQELWDELYGQFGLKGFMAGNTSTQMGGWFPKELKSLEDVRGMAFRTAGLGAQMWGKLGVNVQTLPGGEVYQALESGAIDAGEWVGPWNDLALGLHKVHKHYYGPSMNEPSAALELIVDKKKYDGLPEDLQMMIRAASDAENDIVAAQFNQENVKALNTLVQQHGVQLHRWPESIEKALAEASVEVVQEIADHDELSKRIVESLAAYRRRAVRWAGIAEQPFADSRLRDIPFKA